MADNDAKNPDDGNQQADARLDADFTDVDDLGDEEIAEIERSLLKAAKEHRIDLENIPKTDTPAAPESSFEFQAEGELDAQIAEAEARLKAALSDEGDDEPHAEYDIPEPSRDDPLDPELRQRVENFGRKLDEIGARRESTRKAKKSQSDLDREAARGLGIGMTVAYLIIGVPLIGALVGYLIDRYTKGTNSTAIGVVVGAVLGVAMAISVMNRANRE